MHLLQVAFLRLHLMRVLQMQGPTDEEAADPNDPYRGWDEFFFWFPERIAQLENTIRQVRNTRVGHIENFRFINGRYVHMSFGDDEISESSPTSDQGTLDDL